MTFVEVKYYGVHGNFIGETEYKSEHSASADIRKELAALNAEGRLPSASGRIDGFVSFEITLDSKDTQGLMRL